MTEFLAIIVKTIVMIVEKICGGLSERGVCRSNAAGCILARPPLSLPNMPVPRRLVAAWSGLDDFTGGVLLGDIVAEPAPIAAASIPLWPFHALMLRKAYRLHRA